MEIFLIIVIIILAIVALKLFSMLFSAIGKILIIALVVFLVYATFAHASMDLAFEGFMFSGQSITVDDKPFIVSFEGTARPASIQVTYYSSYFFVPQGQCKTIKNVEFCFIFPIFDTDLNKFKVNLSVYNVIPEIKITRILANSTLTVGDETAIDANVSNGIGVSADNFEYIDSFSPEEFEVTRVRGDCNEENNSAVYRGFLRQNQSIECEYNLKALKEVKRSTKAKVTYFDGIETQTLFSSAVNFDVSSALTIKSYFNESDKKVLEGDPVIFIINMTNKKDENINDLVLNISLPTGLVFNSTKNLELYFNETSNKSVSSQRIVKINEGLLQFTGNVDKNQSKFIALQLTATRGGMSDIFLDASYTWQGSPQFTEKKDTIEVEHNEIVVFTSFQDGQEFDAGEQRLFKIGVSNPSERTGIRNITVRVETNLSQINKTSLLYLDKMGANTLISQNIEMPLVDFDTTYPVNIIADYDTDYGQHYEESYDFDVVVRTIAGLSIGHDISKTTVQSGEEFTVKTRVKNDRNIDLRSVRVFDVVPMDFKRIGLNSVSNLDINAKDEVVAYEFRMVAPEVGTPKTYLFRTTAKYEENNKTYAFENLYEVTVEPKQKDLSIARVISEPNPAMGAILDIIYTITNPDDKETLEDIRLKFPVQQHIDLIGPENYTIGMLLPGESFTIRDVHRVRLKNNGTVTIAPTMFIYNDEEGNIFVKNSSETTFDADYGYITGSAFVVEKTSNNTVSVGDLIDVKLSVRNVGSEAGAVEITDSENTWKLQLEPSERDIITYKIIAEKEGIMEFKPAFARYYYRGKDVLTVSNTTYTNVTQKKEAQPPAEEKIKEVTVEKVKEEAPKKKTFLEILRDAMQMVLNIFKRK